MSYGPPTAQGRALLIIVLVFIPLGFIYLSFPTAERGLKTSNIIRDNFRTQNSVKTKVVTVVEDSHESIQELRKLLWWMDDEGHALFGDAHEWRIKDYQEGESYEEIGERLVHRDFALKWNARSGPGSHDKAREVMLEYGRQRIFYSKMNQLISKYNRQAKTELRELPSQSTYDKTLDAKDLALQVGRFMQEGEGRRDAFKKVIKPFFR